MLTKNSRLPRRRPYWAVLARRIEEGAIPAVNGEEWWRLKDLARWIFEEFGIAFDETTVGRTVKRLGYTKLSTHPQARDQNKCESGHVKKFLGHDRIAACQVALGHDDRDLASGVPISAGWV